MSSFFKSAAVAVWFFGIFPTWAETLPAAITPPLPKATLPGPWVPADSALTLTRFSVEPFRPSQEADPIAGIVARQANISNFGTSCGPSLRVHVATDAMLAVQILAPCLPYEAVRLEHEDLTFTAPMSMTGELSFLLPVLNEHATLKAVLADGTVLEASADVPDVRNFARVALQWSGADAGELIAKAPRVLDGTMARLGQSNDADGAVLHVFSRRINDLAVSGVVRLSMRAPVTAANCAKGHAARVRRVVPGEPVSAYDLAIKGLGCGAVGQTLELKNVLQDLKLAGN